MAKSKKVNTEPTLVNDEQNTVNENELVTVFTLPDDVEETTEGLTIEQKIEKFAQTDLGFVKANDFLNELIDYKSPLQPQLKLLRKKIDDLVESKSIIVANNTHKLLGLPFYPDGVKQSHRGLDSVQIFLRKVNN